MAMSDKTYERKLKPILERFHKAQSDGVISGFQCWSPEDTLADTRMTWNEKHEIIFYREADLCLRAIGY